MSDLKISVVLCTFQRVELFRNALASLIKQTAPKDEYEIIVVDNEKTPNAEVEAISLQASQQAQVRYLHESNVGLSNARTSGGKAAQAAYVAYFDDDAKAPETYVQQLIDILNTQQPDIFGGPYYPFYLESKPAWFCDKYGSGANYGERARLLKQHETLSGANIIFRRDVLEKINWFDARYSMVGKKMWYGSETVTQFRAWDSNPNLHVYYDPTLIIYHLVPAQKMSVAYRLRVKFQMGRVHVYLWIPDEQRGEIQKHAPYHLCRAVLVLLVKSLPGLLFRDRKHYPYWQNYVIEKTGRLIGIISAHGQATYDLLLKK